MAEGHHSIAEHATITIGVEGLSRASSHQLVRARIASYAQQSQRHVVIKGEYFVIPQSIIDAGEADYFSECMAQDLEDYAYLINAGVPVEDARYVLSSATTTNIVITMNMRSWRHFFEERMCLKAQTEIREMATKIFWVCNEIVPELLFGNFPKCGSKGECAKCGGPS
jgi:thymidylate synthase (FAD)